MFEAFFLVAEIDGFLFDELGLEHLAVVIIAIIFGKRAIVQSCKHGTAWLVRMRAIAEPALVEQPLNVRKAFTDAVNGVPETEFTHTRRVDDQRSHPVDESAIFKMLDKFEPPTLAEAHAINWVGSENTCLWTA